MISREVVLDRLGVISGVVVLEGGDGAFNEVQLLVDGEVAGNVAEDGHFEIVDVPVGEHSIDVALSDYTSLILKLYIPLRD